MELRLRHYRSASPSLCGRWNLHPLLPQQIRLMDNPPPVVGLAFNGAELGGRPGRSELSRAVEAFHAVSLSCIAKAVNVSLSGFYSRGGVFL